VAHEARNRALELLALRESVRRTRREKHELHAGNTGGTQATYGEAVQRGRRSA
jgi:hypothetical protein